MIPYNKRGFQLSLFTVFITLLFMGTVGVNTALAADFFAIKVVIKEECFIGPGKPVKRTIKSEGQFAYAENVNNLKGKNGVLLSPFPFWDDVRLTINNFEPNGNTEILFATNNTSGDAGIALSKNLLTGTFQTIMDSGNGVVGNRFMAISGKLVVDKDGEGQKVVAKITGYDGTRECTYNGKFKGKGL